MVAETMLPRLWKCGRSTLKLGERTLIMGVLNVTPDSFSDGGRFTDPHAAIAHAIQLQTDGADLIDLGAESTRPGSSPVPDAEQLRRLLPVLDGMSGNISIPISIDTSSSSVAGECLAAGASVINDIRGFRSDTHLADTCAKAGAGAVLMHLQGTPETMQRDPQYGDLLAEVREFLRGSVAMALDAGLARENIVVDPGIGFGKTFEHNYRLLGALHEFSDLAAGVLVGPSRKSFLAEFSGLPPDQRQFPTSAAVTIAALHGADVIRVHDVREMREVLEVTDRFRTVEDRREL
jgi:dihydropteroate synthase